MSMNIVRYTPGNESAAEEIGKAIKMARVEDVPSVHFTLNKVPLVVTRRSNPYEVGNVYASKRQMQLNAAAARQAPSSQQSPTNKTNPKPI